MWKPRTTHFAIMVAIILVLVTRIGAEEQQTARESEAGSALQVGIGDEQITDVVATCEDQGAISDSTWLGDKKNCGLGQTCDEDERCCRVGVTVWCCDEEDEQCDYDNIGCKDKPSSAAGSTKLAGG